MDQILRKGDKPMDVDKSVTRVFNLEYTSIKALSITT